MSFRVDCYKNPRLYSRHTGGLRFLAADLVAEVAHAGEDHGDAVFVGGGDDFFVAHRAAGLDDGAYACRSGGVHPVAEGEEGVAGKHAAVRVQAFGLCFQDGDL